MKQPIYLACLLSAAASSPAWAQEPATGFAGPRAELRIGGEMTTVGVSVDDGTATGYGADDQEGITFAGELGYDLRLGGKFVGGVYGGLDFSSVARCQSVFGGDEACLEADRTVTLGGRAGIQPSRNSLLYLKGGYSRTRFTFTYEDGLAPGIDEDEEVEGFHLGGGIEMGLGGSAYGRLEYVYTDYNDGRATFDDGTEVASDLNRQQVLVGLGFRF